METARTLALTHKKQTKQTHARAHWNKEARADDRKTWRRRDPVQLVSVTDCLKIVPRGHLARVSAEFGSTLPPPATHATCSLSLVGAQRRVTSGLFFVLTTPRELLLGVAVHSHPTSPHVAVGLRVGVCTRMRVFVCVYIYICLCACICMRMYVWLSKHI